MKRFIINIFIILMVPSTLNAQNFDALFKEGLKHVRQKEFNTALELFLKAEEIRPGNLELNLQIGRTYLQSDYKYKSLPYLKKVYQLAPDIDSRIKYDLGLAYHYNYMFKEAIEYYTAFELEKKSNKALTYRRIKECISGDSILRYPVAVEIENLGPEINSPESDYMPIITQDEDILIFTSRREGSTGGKRTKDNEFYEDIYISRKVNDKWTKPESISPNINTAGHEAAVAISADGKEIFFYTEVGDILSSKFDGNKWSKPVKMPYPINSDAWDLSVSLSSDGQKLFLSSDREGGYGGTDLYVCEKQANGTWGEPKNLGPVINTTYDEDFPFLHFDGSTLYFSSNGHPGLGGHDIFKSKLVDGVWQKPENLGYPINTPENNFQFIMAKDNSHAYYSSVQEDGYGKIDLYKVVFLDIKHKTQLEEVMEKWKQKGTKTVVKDTLSAAIEYIGNVISGETGKGIEARITISDYLSGESVVETYSNAEGNFVVYIPEEGTYAISVEAPDHIIFSQKLKAERKNYQQKVQATLKMNKIEIGNKSVLVNIHFDIGNASLNTESIAELEKLKEFLKESPNLMIQINGHTDNTGNPQSNKVLSTMRAEAVMKYLVQHGIDESRLSVMGYGDERPLVSNDDEEEGREINRRTEIEIVSY